MDVCAGGSEPCAVRPDGEQLHEQSETRHDKPERNDRETRAQPREQGALGGEEYPRIGFRYRHGVLSGVIAWNAS